MKNKKWLWIMVEKYFEWLNRVANPRGVLLNYSVVKLEPVGMTSIQNGSNAGIGILIQGPILFPKFLDTVINFYSVNYPDVPILLSTWEGETKLKNLLTLDRIELIESEPPTRAGISNMNYQVKSTIAGLNLATSMNLRFTLKIRSDQGLFASNFLHQFCHAIKFAPDSGHDRIVTTDFNSFLFRINSPSDQIQFGSTSTLIDFWSAYEMNSAHEGGFTEEVLLLAYLDKIGCKRPITLKDSLEIYRDHFVFLDSTDLGLVWRKGSWRHPDSRFEQLDRTSLQRYVSPDEWKRLHTDIESVVSEFHELRRTKHKLTENLSQL